MTRTFCAALFLALFWTSATAPQAEVRLLPGAVLRRYLAETDPAKRGDMRTELLRLNSAQLRDAIAEHQPAPKNAPPAGEIEALDIKGPDGHTRPHFVAVPPKYDARKRYPMIVLLHGGCARAPAEWARGMVQAFEERLPEKWKSEVILLGVAACVPKTSPEAVWYKEGGLANVSRAITEIKARYNVDDDRVFVSGFSDGASGSFGFAYLKPDAFAGFLPLCGHPTVPSAFGCNTCMQNLKGLNIYSVSGGKDDLYPAEMVLDYMKTAKAVGANVETKVYPDAVHSMDSLGDDCIPILVEQKVAKWKRDLCPSEIDWTADRPALGRRAWLSIDAIGHLGPNNGKRIPQPPFGRVALGILPEEPDDLKAAPVVENVVPNYAAAKLGIVKGDKILKIDGAKVADFAALLAAMAKKEWGAEIEVVVSRDGKEHTLKGSIPVFVPRKPVPMQARVVARSSPGKIELDVHNATRVSLWVHEGMLKNGKFGVTVNGKAAGEFTPVANNELILSEFERTGDRKLPFIARIELDIAKLLK